MESGERGGRRRRIHTKNGRKGSKLCPERKKKMKSQKANNTEMKPTKREEEKRKKASLLSLIQVYVFVHLIAYTQNGGGKEPVPRAKRKGRVQKRVNRKRNLQKRRREKQKKASAD